MGEAQIIQHGSSSGKAMESQKEPQFGGFAQWLQIRQESGLPKLDILDTGSAWQSSELSINLWGFP